MDVTLKPEIEQMIDDDIKSGRSTDPSDFLNRAAYHYLVARDLGEAYSREDLDRLIAEGLEDIERGDAIDGHEAFQQLRSHSIERRKQRR